MIFNALKICSSHCKNQRLKQKITCTIGNMSFNSCLLVDYKLKLVSTSKLKKKFNKMTMRDHVVSKNPDTTL